MMNVVALMYALVNLHIFKVFGNNIEIQPMDPSVHEGDDVTLSCFSRVEGAVVQWFNVPQSGVNFQVIRSSAFPSGMNLHLINASRSPHESSSLVSFLCTANYNDEIYSKTSSVNIVPPNHPLQVQSGLIIFPSNPVAQNGTNYTLTCISPFENETEVGWYIPGDATSKFQSYNTVKFDNGAHVTLYAISVDTNDPTISIVCLKTASVNLITKRVTIQIFDYLPTTEPPVETILPNQWGSTTTMSTGSGSGEPEVPFPTSSIPVRLVLIAIGLGSALTTFCIALMFLSIYIMFLLRSRSLQLIKSNNSDEVFDTSPRSIDNHHPYQSVQGGSSTAIDERKENRKESYADLRRYEEPRVYMRLESKSSSLPNKQDVSVPEGIYDGEIPSTQLTSYRQERTSQV